MKAGAWAQKASGPEDLLNQIYDMPLAHPPGTRSYSDLGYVVLGKVIESVTGIRLDAYFEKQFTGPLGLTRTGFNPVDTTDIAPTELDMEWRMRQIHGTVHDPIADVLGGVAGHAGLFANASDVAQLMVTLVTSGLKHNGWDSKSPTKSSAGDLFSADSYGQLGYTGGSVWTDPQRKLSVIFLTNRTNPTANTTAIRSVRPQLHDAVIRALSALLSAQNLSLDDGDWR
jgi:CubicO group peptidase (beta-lactamase class C family)